MIELIKLIIWSVSTVVTISWVIISILFGLV